MAVNQMHTYDDPVFFVAYSQMDRSRYGLSAAGEWHQLKKLFPDVTGAAVLDLGCGYGWHSKYCSDHGAAVVRGIDASAAMIEEAKKRNPAQNVTYTVCTVEDYSCSEGTFDFVFSNLVLHYVSDLQGVYRKVFQVLRPGGIFLFNIEHPTFTASPGQDWIYQDGKPAHWPVDDYFYPGERKTVFCGCEVKKYHHTLTQILGGMLNAGFVLEAVEEAMPREELAKEMPEELRRPMMLLVRGRKNREPDSFQDDNKVFQTSS